MRIEMVEMNVMGQIEKLDTKEDVWALVDTIEGAARMKYDAKKGLAPALFMVVRKDELLFMALVNIAPFFNQRDTPPNNLVNIMIETLKEQSMDIELLIQVNEAWTSESKDGNKPCEDLSEDPNAREAIIMTVETKTWQDVRIIPIEDGEMGKVSDNKYGVVRGRMFNRLCPPTGYAVH